jgi:(2Fe-2S) ferredoxin
MPPFTHLILVCCNKRPDGHPRGCCNPDESDALRKAFKQETKKRSLGPLIRATKSGCLEQCQHGPVVAIYPQGIFYGNVTEKDIPRIFDETVLNNRIIDDLLIQEECLNNPQCEHVEQNKSS